MEHSKRLSSFQGDGFCRLHVGHRNVTIQRLAYSFKAVVVLAQTETLLLSQCGTRQGWESGQRLLSNMFNLLLHTAVSVYNYMLYRMTRHLDGGTNRYAYIKFWGLLSKHTPKTSLHFMRGGAGNIIVHTPAGWKKDRVCLVSDVTSDVNSLSVTGRQKFWLPT